MLAALQPSNDDDGVPSNRQIYNNLSNLIKKQIQKYTSEFCQEKYQRRCPVKNHEKHAQN